MIRTHASVRWLLAALCLLPASGRAGGSSPVFVRELDTIPLIDPQGPVPGAWHGGFEKARPQLVDADGDGDLDAFVTEEDGKLRHYRNDGDAFTPDFRLLTDDYGGGRHALFFNRLADIDADGDQDLLVEAPEFLTIAPDSVELWRPGAYLYENTGTAAAPVWEVLSTRGDGYLADENGDRIPFLTTTPDLVDLDGDGDLDLLMGVPSGAIILYRNVGTPTAPVFRFETDAYQDILIIFGACNPEISHPITLGELVAPEGPDGRHGFMMFSFFDVDGDTRPDLFVGDSFNANVYYYENIGGNPDPGFQCVSEAYFPDEIGAPGSFTQQLVSSFGDLDGDGDPDCVMGGGAPSQFTLWYFRNDGAPGLPQFRLVTDSWLREFDRGRISIPAAADPDRDGLTDLYVGFETFQQLSHYGNVGSATDPAFAAFQENWLPLPNASWIAAEFADIDADSDDDLFVGMVSGAVRFFRNDGSSSSPAFVEVVDHPAFGDGSGRLIRQSVRAQATPRFLDEDADGDLDLVVGQWQSGEPISTLHFFRNDGTAQAHDFVLGSADWRGLGTFGRLVVPELGDLDGDGDPDLVAGGEDGRVQWWRNIGTPAQPVFEAAPELGIDVGRIASPALADVDDDGDLDLFVGETGGGLSFFRNESPPDRNPTAFALGVPAADEAIDGRRAQLFDWESSSDPDTGGEATYTLRLAPSPDAPPAEWRTIEGLVTSEADVVIHVGELRFQPEFWWTVVASDGARNAPVPEWRRGQHATWDPVHGAELDAIAEDREFVPAVGPPVDVLALSSPYPSPTRGSATVAFALPQPGRVSVRAYDVQGRRVATLEDGDLGAGPHELVWDGRTDRGGVAGPGIYLVRLEWQGQSLTRRLVRIP